MVAGFWIPVVVKIKPSKKSRKRVDVAVQSDPGGLWPPPPYILADRLTLFKTGGADYAHHYTTCPPPHSVLN